MDWGLGFGVPTFHAAAGRLLQFVVGFIVKPSTLQIEVVWIRPHTNFLTISQHHQPSLLDAGHTMQV